MLLTMQATEKNLSAKGSAPTAFIKTYFTTESVEDAPQDAKQKAAVITGLGSFFNSLREVDIQAAPSIPGSLAPTSWLS